MSNKNKKNTVICVLGMHRSGTSMLMRLLNICGICIGEERDMVSATNSNKKGYWEHKKVLKINEEILKIFDGQWERPPMLKDGWENDSRLSELYVEAKKFIDKMNNDYDVWGFKEPRTCLTLPFWQKIIPNMTYIISFRTPNDVAKSLHKRGDMIFSDGVILWALYWKLILKYTKREKKYFTFFDRFFLNWQKELKGLVKFIDKKNITMDGHESEIEDFISPNLRHDNTLIDNIENNIIFNNMTNEIILEWVWKAYLNEENKFSSQIIKDQIDIIEQKEQIISQKNVQLKQKKQQIEQVTKKYNQINDSKSLKLGNLFFCSIKNPYKLIMLPINFIEILMK